MKTSKSQESGLNKIRSFFEIKRPTKATSSSSISSPPDAAEMDENGSEKANGNRLFIRNHKHRNSSRKFRLKTVPSPIEAEAKVAVKDIREMFENLAVENETKPLGNDSSRLDDNDTQLLKDIEYKEAKIGELWNIGDSDEISQRFIDRRITKEVSELQKLYEQLKVKRRSNGKKPREPKIASFAEAENEVEAEEYRKSLIEQMDQEIANMRAEGFMDADENTIDENNNQEGIGSFDDTSQAPQQKTNPIDGNGDLYQPLEPTLLQAYRSRMTPTVAEAETIEEQREPKPGATADEFGESLEDLESGITVFEAYNDDGRELIEIQLEVHKKTVNPSSGVEVSLEDSQMVFYKENDTYTLLHDTVGDAFEATQTEHIRLFFPTRSSTISRNSSTRSAAYSSASMDSSTFEEDDEGIVVSRNNDDEIYSNVRRLTISDKNGVVRIEREVGPGDPQEEDLKSSVSRSNSTTPARQLEFIMNEIITTERKYVEDLGKIVNNFKPYIENHTPVHFIGMTGYIFGNIERIYKKQNKFLEALENCGDYIYGIVRCFLGHKSLFDQYQHYFKNKPKSDIVIKNFHETIKDMQDYFKERLELSAYLLTPVQRLGKYILFLENIEKQLFKLNQPTEIVKEALSMMKSEMSKGNDAVAIESIVNSRISKLDYGSFKMREQFSISKPKKMEAMVFLFENVLVFASTDQKNLDTFNYIDSIKMVDLRIATFNDYTIHLTDYTNSKRKKNPTRYTYILEAKTEKIWEMWKTSIENALWQQLEAVKESVSSTPRRFIKNGVNRRIKSTVKMHRGTPDNFLANVSSTSELQTNNAVKNIRRLFENLAGEQNKPTATKPPGHAPNRPFSLQDYGRNETLKELLEDIRYKEARIRDLESYNYTDETSKRFIDGRLAKELSELQELYEQVKVKRRSPQGRNPQEPRIASEAEAENEVEAERYRKSLIDQMDQEIANMKAGGFMDPDEEIAQLADASQPLVDEAEASTPSKNILMEALNILDDLQQTTKSEMAVAPIEPKPVDEFGESIDELDDGLIFEAYNDEGRELVEIGLHRRTVQLPSNRNSQLVFQQEEEKTYTAGQLIGTQTDRSTGYSSMSGESSTRSAAYSSASMDFEEDDEGVVVIERDHQDKIHRIVERISFGDGKDPCGTMTVESLDTPGTGRGSATPARQLLFIIAEIKATEKKYVKDLYKITNNFKPYIQNFAPKHLFGCSGYIFGNIESIYKEQMKFLDNLENCGGYIYGIIRCFLSHKSLFEKYQIYFRNKPKADIVIKSFQDTIKDMQDYFQEKLELSTYLLTPVQRLGKYILFLENIEKQLFKLNQPTEIVKEALSMMKSEMSKGNDAVAIESIVNSPISKLDYGSFKMKEQFSISKPKKMEAIVFLFENVLVFASSCQVYMNFFEYIDSIEMNDLRIASFNDYSIHLTDYTKSKLKEDPAKYTYVLEAKTKKIFELWTTSIEDILWQQLVAVKKSVTSAPRRSFKTGIHRRIKSAVK